MSIRRAPSNALSSTPRRLLAIAGVAALALVGAGCGDDDDGGDDGASTGGDDGGGDMTAARETFVGTCGGCHTLEDAGTTGNVGPELTGGGYDAETVASVIAEGQGAMPAGLLQGDEAEQVAEYVADASSE